MSAGKTIRTNFFTDTLTQKNTTFVLSDLLSAVQIEVTFVLFYKGLKRRKKLNIKQANIVMPVFPKVSLGNAILCLTVTTLSHKSGE